MKKIILFFIISFSLYCEMEVGIRKSIYGNMRINSDTKLEDSYSVNFEYMKKWDETYDVGLGVSYQEQGKEKDTGKQVFKSLPIYLILKKNLSDTLYTKANLGYSINMVNTEFNNEFAKISNINLETDNGIYGAFAIGKYFSNISLEALFELFYANARMKDLGTEIEEDYTMYTSKISINLGYSF